MQCDSLKSSTSKTQTTRDNKKIKGYDQCRKTKGEYFRCGNIKVHGKVKQ